MTTTGTGTGTEAVIESYQRRAAFARAETAHLARPRLLRGLLPAVDHVAEIPCGAGHFLADYARSALAVTLVDASAAMLAAATENAVHSGLSDEKTRRHLAYVQQPPDLTSVGLIVVPNAALNQLACQTALVELLMVLRAAVAPWAVVLAQVACVHPGGGVDTAGFYDPARQHGVWFADRWFHPEQAGGAVLRRRRQHRHGERLQIQFDYRSPARSSLHATAIELALFNAADLRDAFTTAGFGRVRFLPGQDGMSEVLAAAGAKP
ncbi:methyltransferase domain-containing protein [Saccharopolyspora sp. ASAGF58]|uniref:methyltransferase domain-containing protein n=1 Tax=Saccharopolyspora sp. ASAGF58 TaxID=2719023 RepID=UPI00144021D1|nr:methyltransferase domain-containing protein [Saccharopolyspora sp. ASAGF58]QIZ37237.1 methyltransferase domain-containing protein [Saccharopolyspora sp. ASAGF58]